MKEVILRVQKDEVRAAVAPGDTRFTWTGDVRLNRVHAGFMRDMTREEVEKVATSPLRGGAGVGVGMS